ncbi:MAG: hypothetical protein FJ146_07515 [Deltaproteobacteria bacterium]|nr:hypothetical protein [Deltaproteobacteria bacterium]
MSVASCAHLRALPQSEIDRLTTCTNTSLTEIRKSLLLSGYEIKDQSATELITAYKQVSGYEGRQIYRRITVVETVPKSFKFVVRLKSVQLPYQDSQYYYRGPLNTVPAPANAININLGPAKPMENEFDPDYIEGNLDEHQLILSEVCGRR